MDKPALFQGRWRWGALLACHLAALLLLLSWLWEPTRLLWNRFDLWLFSLLNEPLATSSVWAYTWAIGSMRPVDAGVGLLMLAVILKGGFVFSGSQVRRALYAFLAVLVVLLLFRVAFAELVKAMDWQRASPSLVVEGAQRLSSMFPLWEERWDMKDHATRSFPGDHASVLLLWAMFVACFARLWQQPLVWGIAAIGILPRLVAGAHWGSDAFVGGLFLCLLAIGWGYYTPYAQRSSDLLERLSAPLMNRLAKLPLLGRLSVINGRD
jgi:membrane-associated phospholipid phosphatase